MVEGLTHFNLVSSVWPAGSVAPSTPPPELSCSECGLPGPWPGLRPGLRTPPGTMPSMPGRGLPVSRSAPAMDAAALMAASAALQQSQQGQHQSRPHQLLEASRRSSVASEPPGSTASADNTSACGVPSSTASTAASAGSLARGAADRRRSSCPHVHAVTVTVSPPPTPAAALPARSASAWLVSSLRCRISNASLFRYREEGRAARVSAIVVVMALGCWAPYVAVLVLHAALPPGLPPAAAAGPGRHLDALALAALAAAVCISPCLFAFRNRRVQKEVSRLPNIPPAKAY